MAAAAGRGTVAERYAAADTAGKEAIRMNEIDLLALADGNHDFSELRGTKEVQTRMRGILDKILGRHTLPFKDMLETFPKIGTHDTRKEFKKGDIIDSEQEALSRITGIPHVTYTSNRGGLHTVQHIFGRDYAVTSVLVKEGGEFTQTSKEYFDNFLVPGTMDPTTFYFIIDALNVSFHHLFSPEEQKKAGNEPDGKGRKVVYLECREGTNDSTGKPDLNFLVEPSAGLPIKVFVEQDVGRTDIVYPAYKPGMNDYHYLFDSTFSVSVNQNKNIPDGIKHTNTTFHNKYFTTTVEVNKGKKEEHPSTVNSLLPRVAELFKKASMSRAEVGIGVREQYYSLLQQKRAGDWLQVLSSLDTTRYARKIPAGSDIFLCTHDFLCAAYGLTVGANIILTLYDDRAKTGWTVRFNRVKGGAAMAAAIAAIEEGNRKKLEGDIRAGPDLTMIDYRGETPINDVIDIYMRAKEAKYRSIVEESIHLLDLFQRYVGEITQLTAEGLPQSRWNLTIKNDLEGHIRNILRVYLHLSTFCNYVHDVARIDASTLAGYTKIRRPAAAGGGVTAANYDTMLEGYTTLQNRRNILLSVIEAGTRGTGVNTIQKAIEYTMTKFMTEGNQAMHASQKTREQLVKDLRIFNKVFHPSNTKINAVGLFQFISQIPYRETLDRLHAILYGELVKVAGVYESVRRDISTFLEVLTILIHTGSGVAPVVVFPESGNTEGDIIRSIYRLDTTGSVAEGEAEGEAGERSVAVGARAAAGPSVAGTRRRRELQAIPEEEGDDEEAVEHLAIKQRRSSTSQRGGADEDRQVYQCTMFTPGLRILNAKESRFLSHPRNIEDEAAFLEHAISIHAQPPMVGGRTQRASKRIVPTSVRTSHKQSIRTSQKSKRTAPNVFDLHPLTYLFFYIRDTLFQFEAGYERDMRTEIRFAQLFLAWRSVSNRLLKRYPPMRYPFLLRAVYRILIHLLLGTFPKALEEKSSTQVSKLIAAMKLSRTEIAEYTTSVNIGYFGAPFFPKYGKGLGERTLERTILMELTESMNTQAVTTDTSSTWAKNIAALTHFQKEIVSSLDRILSNEQYASSPLSHIHFNPPSASRTRKAMVSQRRATVRAKSKLGFWNPLASKSSRQSQRPSMGALSGMAKPGVSQRPSMGALSGMAKPSHSQKGMIGSKYSRVRQSREAEIGSVLFGMGGGSI